MASADPIANAEADPNPELNVYVDVVQNVGDKSGPAPKKVEEEVPEVEIPTTVADDDLFEINGQKFKYILNSGLMSFDEAKDICSSEGLQMAQPDDSSVVELKKYLHEEYSFNVVDKENLAWVGATAYFDATTAKTVFNWMNGEGGPSLETQLPLDFTSGAPPPFLGGECVALDGKYENNESGQPELQTYINWPCGGVVVFEGTIAVNGVLCQKI